MSLCLSGTLALPCVLVEGIGGERGADEGEGGDDGAGDEGAGEERAEGTGEGGSDTNLRFPGNNMSPNILCSSVDKSLLLLTTRLFGLK